MSGPSVYDRIAARVREIAGEQTADAAPTLWLVKQANPLRLEEIGGDGVLDEGDPDLHIRSTTTPAAGDKVLVHRDAHGDYIV